MTDFIHLVQLAIAISVAYVWIFRFHNVEKEFKQFNLSVTVRSFVGTSKIALATLLVVGIWFPVVTFYAAIGMGFFMIAAQYFHYSIKNTFIKHLPSLILLALCVLVAYTAFTK